MPRWVVFLVEFLLDVRRNVLEERGVWEEKRDEKELAPKIVNCLL